VLRFGPLVIVPPGAPAPAGAPIAIQLESGEAFGSGLHPTTALCLERIVERSPLSSLLDVGTGTGILALAAAAWGAWTYLVPHEVDVPRVVGLSLADAQARLDDAGLTARVGKGEFDPTAPVDQVLAQRPAPGTALERGSEVVLVPSLGPPPVRVPNLVGKTIPEARAALGKVGLELGEPTERYDEEYEAGQIVGQSVPAKDRLPQGSTVDVVVSQGPAPVPVPKVVGETQENAQGLLAPWVVNVETEYSDTVERGYVISQDPQRRTKLQPGETVTIVVSLGPERFPAPNLVGMTRDAAVAAVRELGLVPTVIGLPGATGELTVATQLPVAGTTVRVGTTITIYVG
jgi:serine/threonine-protein kinase